MKTLKEKAPALWAMFFKDYELIEISRPYGCHNCPFATETKGEDPPNRADPDEGYYDCALLNRERIWGENPQCSATDWRKKGAEEVYAIAEFTIRREIVEAKATVLLEEFSKAIQDEKNGGLTLHQIKEKLFAGVEPDVLVAFNAKLRAI